MVGVFLLEQVIEADIVAVDLIPDFCRIFPAAGANCHFSLQACLILIKECQKGTVELKSLLRGNTEKNCLQYLV